MTPPNTDSPQRDMIQDVMQSVVQIVALKRGMMGNMSPAWTGSGTIVHPSGLIVTNCHVANPRAMGMPAPSIDRLGIAITERSDEEPVLTYFADVVAQEPSLDLAVLRITTGLDGRPVSRLNLHSVAIGDSDKLDLGDRLSILGFPGIGGETITLTTGNVSGFTKQEGVSDRRAWIKSDATIAGGNSGGTAVDHMGRLVGIPTQAAAGTGITPVDARPVVDTNKDGRVDQRDTPMAIGGFINGLRPVNLVKPILMRATRSPGRRPARRPVPASPSQAQAQSAPEFGSLVFSTKVTQDGRPVNPAEILPAGHQQIFASFSFEGMRDGTAWGIVWAHNGNVVHQEERQWEAGTRGRTTLSLNNSRGLPDGRYHLLISVGRTVVCQGEVTVGRRVEDTDTEVSGQVIDPVARKAIHNALIIALKPGVHVKDFVREQDKDMAYTTARTDAHGKFTFPKQLFKGQAYGLVVVAKGYRDLAIEGALRLNAEAPEHAELSPIPLQRD